MRALLLLRLALALVCACGGRSAEPSVVPVGTVAAIDAGPVPVESKSEPAPTSVTLAMLESKIERSLRLADAILARCVGRMPDDDIVRVKQAQASSYADRDEVVIRKQRDSFGDRDAQAWWEAVRRRSDDLQGIAQRQCPAALRATESP